MKCMYVFIDIYNKRTEGTAGGPPGTITQSYSPCIRQHTSAYVSIRQHTSAYVSIRQHTSAYISIRQHKLMLACPLSRADA